MDSVYVPSFGGGLNFARNPVALEPDQWSGCNGWLARLGCAEVANPINPTPLATVGVSGDEIIGLVANPFTEDGAVVLTVNGFGLGRMFTVTGAGVVTEILPTGSPPLGSDVLGREDAVATAAFVNGLLVVCFGFSPDSGVLGSMNGVVTWDGGATYTSLSGGAAPLRWDFITGFKGHVVGAYGTRGTALPPTAAMGRTVAWSDIDNPAVWTPDVANSADDVVLDDVASAITALLPISSDVLGVFTRDSVQALTPTGQIPAFTRQEVHRGVGCLQLGKVTGQTQQSWTGLVPGGCVFAGGDNLYTIIAGSPQTIGAPIYAYWSKNIRPVAPANFLSMRPFVWHEDLGVLVVPRPTNDLTGTKHDVLYYHPGTQAWSRALLPLIDGAGTFRRHAFIYGYDGSDNLLRRHWFATDQAIFLEDPTAAFAGATVDTKDFAFDEPMAEDYLDRIKIEWEPLTNASTDAIKVLAAARSDPSAGVRGSSGMDTTLSFVDQGTLAGGQSELVLRGLRGKYVRFRFQQVSGRARIRGFALRRQRAGDKRT